MPLDVTVVRDPVEWSRLTSDALREGVESLEDHLIGLGFDDLDLRIEVRKLPAGLVGVTFELCLTREPLTRYGEDIDLALLITRLAEEVEEEATLARVLRGGGVGRSVPTAAEDPWTAIREDLYAIAHREVSHAVAFGDLPAGWVDANDLTDEAILEFLAHAPGEPPSLRDVAKRVRNLLTHRIRTAAESAENVFLDETVPNPDPSEPSVQDEFYEFRMPDETPLRGEDVIGEFESPDDRIAAEEPTDHP